jgi:hypothetical protein
MLAFKLKITIDCPDGFHHEDGECVPGGKRHRRFECPEDFHWDGDECVPDWKRKKNKGGGGCVVGFHWNGHRCVRDRDEQQKGGGGCVVGFHWNGHKCIPDGGQKKTKDNNEFPPIEGQEGDEGFSCSHNDHLENGKCVPCKAGFHVEGDECVAD